MSQEEDGTFTIIWRLKNFSMCPVGLGHCILSPVIQVRQFGKSEWSFRIYPRGNNSGVKNFAFCLLNCHDSGINKSIEIECTFCVLNGSLSVLSKKLSGVFEKNESFGFKIADILKERNEYLSKDTLTIKCVMKCKSINPVSTEDKMIDTFLRTSVLGKNPMYLNKCCCETIVSVQTKKCLLQLKKNILYESVTEIFTLPLCSAMKETPTFYVTLLKDDTPFIQIRIKIRDEIKKRIFVKGVVSAVGVTKSINHSSEGEFLFQSEEDEWILPSFLEPNKLEESGYFKINRNVLILEFKFSFSIQGRIHHTEKQYWEPPVRVPESPLPLELFTTANTDDKQPIVTLQAGGKSFFVHKCLLKANSEVFHAMFGNDMMEKETGKVDILDVDPKTMERVLTFLYSNEVGELSFLEVTDLYAAAHKYRILSLMDHCLSLLTLFLDVSNVCEVLIFADLYRDDQLLKCAEDFVVNIIEFERLLMSQHFKNLMETHSSIAANLMYKMLMK